MLVLLAAAGLLPGRAPAAEYRLGGLLVSHAWSRATAAPGANAAAYLTIDNDGPADVLVGLSCSVARFAALHSDTQAMTDMPGMAPMPVDQMRPLAAIPIPAHGHVVLAPGAQHGMLMDTLQTLGRGQKLPCVLHFSEAGSLIILLDVAGPGAQAAPGQ